LPYLVCFCYDGIGSRLRQLGIAEGGDTQYKNPNICFSLKDDHIVLTDGSLWDLRAPHLVHRFDKLSNGGFGAFSPNGNDVSGADCSCPSSLVAGICDACPKLSYCDMVDTYQVIIDNSVWDLRTHNLLKMTGLDQCCVQFSAFGHVIYGYRRPPSDDVVDFLQGRKRTREYSSFSVLDSLDYSMIHIQELEKQVMVRNTMRKTIMGTLYFVRVMVVTL